MANILMPQATAVWLIDNTSLTFDQVAAFCELHPLEVRSIADGEAHSHMRGVDPIAGGELTREEIARGEANADYRLKLKKSDLEGIPEPKRKGARYTPVSRRADKPDAIAWFIRHHPEVPDSQIGKIIGTTKNTINAVRNKEHWNSQNIKPVDPVTLGLCSQIELDEVIGKAAAKRQEMIDRKEIEVEGPGLQSVEDSLGDADDTPKPDADISAEDVFRNFKG